MFFKNVKRVNPFQNIRINSFITIKFYSVIVKCILRNILIFKVQFAVSNASPGPVEDTKP